MVRGDRRWRNPGFLITAVFAVVVLVHFHDRFWYPPDEGAYAYVADQILKGAVLNRDVQDIHFGYVNFANAAALWLFGEDLVSLRYPLVAMGVLQSCLIFLLLLPRGVLAAIAGGVAMTALSTIQYLNPTAHWYALFLCVGIIATLAWLPQDSRWRLELIGLLVVTLLLFRQLTGVLVAIGVLTYVLLEASDLARGRDRLLARALLIVITAGLGGYLFTKTGPIALILFGVWPLAILLWAWAAVGASNRRVWEILRRLGTGGAVAAAPLLLYHLFHGSVGSWFEDTVLAALSLTRLEFMSTPFFLLFLVRGAEQVAAGQGVAEVLNGVFWLVLPLLAAFNGVLILWSLLRRGAEGRAFHPLPLLAAFYALVSVHYQIPIYLFYTTALSLVALLWLVPGRRSQGASASVLVALGLSGIGLYYQAGQPLSRGFEGILRGERIALTANSPLDRASLWMEATDADLYRDLVTLIHRETGPRDFILAVPVNPELYFLSDRESPFRFFTTALGIRDREDVRRALETLSRRPPKLVFYRPDDKYNTAASERIMDFVRQRYERIAVRGGFEIYRYRR